MKYQKRARPPDQGTQKKPGAANTGRATDGATGALLSCHSIPRDPPEGQEFSPSLSRLLDQALAKAERFEALAGHCAAQARRARLIKAELERAQEWREFLAQREATT